MFSFSVPMGMQSFIANFFGTLPIRGTEIAGQWDMLYIFLVLLSLVFFVIVVGAMIFFAYAYRKERHPKAAYIEGNHLLEFIWTAIPTVLVMIIFVWGYVVYRNMVQAPSDAYEIRVIGKQWLWQFQYDNGRAEINKLYVPVNKPVKLVMTSEDVLHSFFVPDFRIKKDVVPGLYTEVWFEATVAGEHHVFCTEYCGTSHSAMIAKVIALQPEQWQQFIKGREISGSTVGDAAAGDSAPKLQLVSLAERGKELSRSKGCVACHSDTGANGIGPTHKALYGAQVELVDGTMVTADENYLRESIENPQAKIVKGFNPVMPTFKGLLKEEEMNALIAYIKSVK